MTQPDLNQSVFWKKLSHQFLPVFIFAAFLPVLLSVVLNRDSLTLFTRAAKNQELRLWLEPNAVITKTNVPVVLKLMAEYPEETRLLSGFSVIFSVSNELTLEQDTLSYSKPFRGRLQVGTIQLTPTRPGKFTVEMPQNQVKIHNTEPVTVITSPASITSFD